MEWLKYLSLLSDSFSWHEMANLRRTPACTSASKHNFAKCLIWARSLQHHAFDRASCSFCDACRMAVIWEGSVLRATEVPAGCVRWLWKSLRWERSWQSSELRSRRSERLFSNLDFWKGTLMELRRRRIGAALRDSPWMKLELANEENVRTVNLQFLLD